MTQPTKAELLVALINDNEQVTVEEIMDACKCTRNTAIQMAYYLVNFRLVYRGDNGMLVAMEHPAEKRAAALEAKVQQLELQAEAVKPALEFANAFKSFMKN